MSLTAHDSANLFRSKPSRFFDVGTGQAAYRTVGNGPDVLFVHGWPVSGATFRTLLPYLADHLTCHVIDLPGAGSSTYDATTPLSMAGHIEAVRNVVDQLGLSSMGVVGHDSGGLIARHALAGDARVRSMALINTEQPQGLSWRFKSFIAARYVPGFGRALGWVAGQPRLRQNKFALGDAFADRSCLQGEFDEFFLQPLHTSPARQAAAQRVLKSFETRHVDELAALHQRITVPVKLIWGDRDPFFPVARAREMVATFPNATLTEIRGAGLFCHEERPQEVAEALLPFLVAG
jgi:haloalkane dehalogenase